MEQEDKGVDDKILRNLKHDIKNQLSAITLLLDHLKHEMPDATPDQLSYLGMITQSAKTIDAILNNTD